MPDLDDTTACAPAQEPAPPADNHFVGVTIDACATIVDLRIFELNRIMNLFAPTTLNPVIFELETLSRQIRALKGNV